MSERARWAKEQRRRCRERIRRDHSGEAVGGGRSTEGLNTQTSSAEVTARYVCRSGGYCKISRKRRERVERKMIRRLHWQGYDWQAKKWKCKKLRRARRAAWWPRCAARCWRAVDRGADSAAAPSHAAGRVASSAPKQTRARGAAAAAKTSTVCFSFSSRLVSSCRRRTRARRAPPSPSGREREGETSEGSRTRRNRPYPVLKTATSQPFHLPRSKWQRRCWQPRSSSWQPRSMRPLRSSRRFSAPRPLLHARSLCGRRRQRNSEPC